MHVDNGCHGRISREWLLLASEDSHYYLGLEDNALMTSQLRVRFRWERGRMWSVTYWLNSSNDSFNNIGRAMFGGSYGFLCEKQASFDHDETSWITLSYPSVLASNQQKCPSTKESHCRVYVRASAGRIRSSKVILFTASGRWMSFWKMSYLTCEHKRQACVFQMVYLRTIIISMPSIDEDQFNQ